MKKYIAICEKSSIMENLAEALPEKLVKRGRNYYGEHYQIHALSFKFHYVSINSRKEKRRFSILSTFKFHYVSINSEVKKYLDWRANGFKFHYVSINSNI